MKKYIAFLLTILLLLTACTGNDPQENANQLIFNSVEVTSILSITHPVDLTVHLSDEQLRAVFPGLDGDISVNATYFDGALRGLVGSLDDRIWFSLGTDRFFDWVDVSFDSAPHQPSDVYGVEVMAFLVNQVSHLSLQVDFSIGNIVYRIRAYDTSQTAQAHITEFVEHLIRTGPADLSVLEEITQ